MLNEKVAQLMNDQINKEFYSSYLYLDMSNYYVDKNLDGFANWFKIQAQIMPCYLWNIFRQTAAK